MNNVFRAACTLSGKNVFNLGNSETSWQLLNVSKTRINLNNSYEVVHTF